MSSKAEMQELLQSGEFKYLGETFRTIPNTFDKLTCTADGKFVGGMGRILKPRKQSSGYLWISYINLDGKHRNVYCHRAVAMCWIDNPECKEYVNHVDGGKHNNQVTNLEWATASENAVHAVQTGLLNNMPAKGQQGFRRLS